MGEDGEAVGGREAGSTGLQSYRQEVKKIPEDRAGRQESRSTGC